MLNIEVIKFEAQDVITASGVVEAPAETVAPCAHKHYMMVGAPEGMAKVSCSDCGATATYKQGTPLADIVWSK